MSQYRRRKDSFVSTCKRFLLALAASLACVTLTAGETDEAVQAVSSVRSANSGGMLAANSASSRVLLAASSHSSSSSGSSDAGKALHDATATCLKNFRNLDDALAEFRKSGWEVTPYIDKGSYEIRRGSVYGIVSGRDYCMVQTSAVHLAQTRKIGKSLVAQYFPGKYQAGRPEGKAQPCDGFTVFPGRGMIVMSYTAAGNSGACTENSGSAIVLSISVHPS